MVLNNRVSQTVAQRYCSHANCEVEIETVYVYPSDILPDTAPRMNQRICSHFVQCNLQDKTACTSVINFNKPALNTKALLER